MSNTRKLNRHYQSGNKGKVYKFLWNAYQAQSSGWTPIQQPVAGFTQPMTLNTLGNSQFQYLAAKEEVKSFFDISDAFDFGYIYDPDHITALELWENIKKVKSINIIAGGCYYDYSVGYYPLWTSEGTTLRVYGGNYLQGRKSGNIYATQEGWTQAVEVWNKIHVWIIPTDGGSLFNPGTQTAAGRIYAGGTYTEVPVPIYPTAFNFPMNLYYQNYMGENPLTFHIHLPVDFNPDAVFGAPQYILIWNSNENRVEAQEVTPGIPYTKYIVARENHGTGDYIPHVVGELTIHFDIDTNIPLEDNIK